MKRLLLLTLSLLHLPTVSFSQEPDRSQSADHDQSSSFHEYPIDPYDREHWSFAPITAPELPNVENNDWVQQPLDLFVLSQLEQVSLTPLPEASRTTLIRRLKFDLLGMPPSPEEVTQFVEDKSPNAYERLVDSYLSSHHYGERWAQYWLDLARFAETDGFEWDKVRESAWQYRQWVIDSLNDDMPYDRFVSLQLAGDTTGAKDDRIATMFCLAGPDMPDINEQDLRRHDKLNELTGTVGSVLLGLQMQCAQCHDHKFDPISQGDFYRLRAIFEGSVPEMQRDKPFLLFQERDPQLVAHVFARGDLHQPLTTVDPLPPRVVFNPDQQSFDSQSPRTGFVRWLFADDNPLTARVIANRIWQYHFGKSLSENPSDFGLIAAPPTHPQLLDFLASTLRENGWSLKKLHRQILLSATYRQLGHAQEDQQQHFQDLANNIQSDPDNEYFSRFPRRRLDGESIRDALLAVGGTLDRRYGGESVRPSLPNELLQTLLKGQWETSPDPADHQRRSIYTFARRNLRYPIFDVFDRPDAGASCARRNESTTALQSLQMLNSELTLQAARSLAHRVLTDSRLDGTSETDEYEHIVDRLFLTVYSRTASNSETAQLTSFLRENPNDPLVDRVWTLSVALLNTNEFLYVD